MTTSYTENLQNAIKIAQLKAREHGHAHYSAGHLLFGLMHDESGLQDLLSAMDKDIHRIRNWAEFRLEQTPKSTRAIEQPEPDAGAKAAFKEAERIKASAFADQLDSVHVLEAICQPEIAFTAEQLKRFAIGPREIEQHRLRSGNSEEAITSPVTTSDNTVSTSSSHNKSSKELERFCDNLTEQARQGKIDPVIGRDKEIRQLIKILGKRLSPNVLLVGEPGVGKTALVGGLALAILEGKVPRNLEGAAVFELDVSGRLVAGAYKGEVEERLKKVLTAIKAHGKAILFIDEIHILLDDRGAVGSGAINLLKPELARGDLTIIGATTQAENKRFLEKDSAFSRRFSKITVGEPDEDLAVEMLAGIIPRFEGHHGIAVHPESISETVSLAKRYLGTKNLPVSAIELIDLTLSAVRLMNDTTAKEIAALEERRKQLEETNASVKNWLQLHRDHLHRISYLLHSQLEEKEDIKLLAQSGKIGDYLKDRLHAIEQLAEQPKTQADIDDITATVAHQTGIPLGKLQASETDKWIKIEDILRRRVVGQDHALQTVATVLRRSRAGIREDNKPAAVFFFAGPTGTGKTELAKAIAELLFNDGQALIRFDMSEYMERHSAETLLGAPAGFIGHEEGGLLVNKIRQRPYSVILFDEIEKAHPDVYKIFLQVFDEGHLKDKLDKKGDFTNAILIFTSNVASDWITAAYEQGETPTAEALKEKLRNLKDENGRRIFLPEFLGRRMYMTPFAPIDESVAHGILDIQLKNFAKILQKQQIELKVDPAVKDLLIDKGFSPAFGARPLKDVIENELGTPLADKIITGEISVGDKVSAGVDKDEIVWEVEHDA